MVNEEGKKEGDEKIESDMEKRENEIKRREDALKNERESQRAEFQEQREEIGKEKRDLTAQLDAFRKEQAAASQTNKREKVEMDAEKVCLLKLKKEVDKKEREAENDFPLKFEKEFQKINDDINKRQENCKNKEIDLAKLENQLKQQEIELKAEIAKKQIVAEQELELFRIEKLKFLDGEITEARVQEQQRIKERHNQLDNEIEAERSARREAINKELMQERELLDSERKQFNSAREIFIQEQTSLRKERIQFDEAKTELDFEKAQVENGKHINQQRKENLDKEARELADGTLLDYKQKIETKQEEIERLREENGSIQSLLYQFEDFKRMSGGKDIATAILELNEQIDTITALRKELASRPTKDLQEQYDKLSAEKASLKTREDRLRERENELKELNNLRIENARLLGETELLSGRIVSSESERKRLQDDIRRLTSYHGDDEYDDEEYNRRIEEIRTPCLKFADIPYPDKEEQDELSEDDFLNGIESGCEKFGYHFPHRILYAFHTALKTAEWNPITVLAGVSGTGKSALPRLYSRFGGINFISVPVLPSWDSPESMLGYFNSIDNKYHAEPILRLLAQTLAEKTNEYPGLWDYMTMILLDEMNLAHPELYFAEFLSKLEQRRDYASEKTPEIEIKLGSGIKAQHYELKMERNALWVGTMNEDETTKSLSDKVLDRGIIINFPKPKIFERREEWQKSEDPRKLISRETWFQWCQKASIFSGEQINEYKEKVQRINTYLGNANRSIGHRVWQSIEFYMSNYPGINDPGIDDGHKKKLMDISFEDQLVQKVMPKLRGIETEGRPKEECLDKIATELRDYDIREDFEQAMRFGDGQFLWSSAKYIEKDEAERAKSNKESDNS